MSGIAVCLVSSVGAQTNSVSIYVDDPRPVAEAIKSLVDRYPVVITYEDPRLEYSRDIKDVTDEIRNPLAPPSTRRTLVPRGGILQVSYDVSVATGEPTDVAEVLRRILEANDAGPAGGRFRVLESSDVFHVVPTAIRDARGAWVAQTSVLDTPISLSVDSATGHSLLDAIGAKISEASSVRVAIDGQSLINTLVRYTGSVSAVDEPAREVLLRVLHSISPSLTWRMFCSPRDNDCFVNVAAAKGMLIEPPAVLPSALPAPRPGDPTPTGAPFRPGDATPAFRLDTLPPERR